jgi:hypothetical protein
MPDDDLDIATRADRGGVWTPAFEATDGDRNNRFRAARFRQFRALLAPIARRAGGAPVRVLDIGGAPGYWMGMEQQWRDLPLEITIVNLGSPDADHPPYFVRGGDACALEFADNSFDIVHSNSVIEHVGHWREMRRMAGEVRRLAPHYFVQTPNFWFPYEPHFKTPFMHWLPESLRAAMLEKKPRGWIKVDSFDQAMTEVQDIVLLTARQMGALFPDARIERERIGPFTKSLVAIR